MSFVAVADLPYGYYTLLRVVACATSVFVLVVAATSSHWWAVWLFAVLAGLFNPIVPVHLTKGLWQPLDVLAGIAFVASAVLVRRRRVT